MSNSQTLDDLRYCAEAFTTDAKFQAEANLRQFAAGLIGAQISLPAQKPASVPGGSGAALVGIPKKAVIFIKFRCPDFGTNSLVCCLHDWPGLRRSIGRKNLLEVRLSGSLV